MTGWIDDALTAWGVGCGTKPDRILRLMWEIVKEDAQSMRDAYTSFGRFIKVWQEGGLQTTYQPFHNISAMELTDDDYGKLVHAIREKWLGKLPPYREPGTINAPS